MRIYKSPFARALFLSISISVAILVGCGKARPLNYQAFLGDAVVGNGGTRVDGSNLGLIYQVTQLSTGIGVGTLPGYANPGDYPFVFTSCANAGNAANSFGDTSQNCLTPFYFTFSYPPNNYMLSAAHLVMDVQRDPTDTEGIFINGGTGNNGVFTGTPPVSQYNAASPKIKYPYYSGNSAGNPPNTYYIDYSLNHYTTGVWNSFDLDMANVLPASTVTIFDVVSTGNVQVVIGDDSYARQAFLVTTGYTLSPTPLNCTNTSTFTYTNQYVHQDGNSIGQSAFTGTVETPFVSWSSGVVGFKSIEYYFDPSLPRVNAANVTISASTLTMNIKRDNTPTAIVISGVGISEPGFDRTNATTSVSTWYDAGLPYWQSVLAGVPTNQSSTAITIDLLQLLGASQLATLMAQGKLNIAMAGGIRGVQASNATSTRTYGVAVSGPNFNINGTYFNSVCTVPNNPASPIGGGNPPPSNTSVAPNIYSVTVSEVTSTGALIQWLTDQAVSTQVMYGVGNTNSSTPLVATPATFHSVQLTGLSPYKYYYFQVQSANTGGGSATSPISLFRTLR